MVDKTKTIKNATTKELQSLLDRLRAESEAQSLIGDIERKNSSSPTTYRGIRTEDPIDLETETGIKSITIKSATDQELGELLTRLRTESNIQSVISDLRSKAISNDQMPYPGYSPESYQGISKDTPIKDLYHYGILGMRWGIRRSASALAKRQSKNIDRDIKTFKPYEKTGIRTKDGRMIMSPEEVQGHIRGLNDVKDRLHGKKPSEEPNNPFTKVTSSTPETNRLSDDYMTAELLKTRDYRTMSNTEMNALNQRLQLERSYRSLKTADRQKGLETVQNITKVVATVGGLYALTKTPMVQDLIKKTAGSAATKAAATAATTAVASAAS